MHTFVISEVGSNHNRNFELAKECIRKSKWAGADAVKFQTYSSETLYAPRVKDFGGYKNINKLIKDIELPRHWQADLKRYAEEEIGIEWFSTPFDEFAVDELVEIGVKRLKIAGFESTDPRLVKYCAKTKLPIIFSAGIGGDPQKTIDWILEENLNADITALHCNNAYPTPPEDVNLDTLEKWQYEQWYDWANIGLSDHTMSTLTPALAVIRGATVIEKHTTVNNNFSGPDHLFALEYHAFKKCIDNIRYAEKCFGVSEKITPSEEKMKEAMRSAVAKADIVEGDVFSEENITTMRSCLSDSLPAEKYYNLLGKKCKYSYKTGDIIQGIEL